MENQQKYAVITNMEVNTKVWHCGIQHKDTKIINIAFYKKLNTHLLENTLWKPRELYMTINKYNMFDYKGSKSKKYGVIESRNTGSFTECFEATKFRSIKKILVENGFTIIDNRKPLKEKFSENDYKANSYIFGAF